MYKFLLALAFYLPFQIALNPTKGVDLASIRVLILIIFLFWLAQGLKNKKLNIKNTLQTWLLVAFMVLNLLSVFVAKNTDWSWRKLLFLFSITPLYFVVADVVNSREKISKLAKAFVLGGAVVSIIGIVQFLAQFAIGLEKTYKFWADYVIVPFLGKSFSEAVLLNPSWLVNVAGETYLRATATFPDPHMLSFYLGLLIPMALGILIYEKKRKFLWIFCLIILLLADLLTFSRGGYLGLFGGAIFIIILFFSKLGFKEETAAGDGEKPSFKKKISNKYKTGALALISLMVVSLLFSNPVSQRFYSSFNLKEGSNAGRIETWKKAIEVVADNPLVGVGIGNYALAIKADASYREPIYAHNTYLDIAAETGILNALIWFSLLGTTAFALYIKGKKDGLLLMLAVSIVIFSIHSLAETAIYSPVVLTLLVSIIGISNIDLKNEKVS